ncbi:MAG TPA: tetratricopeptide repeat protein, partial [Chthoniobacterales bacterium]
MKYSFRILFLLALTWSVLPKPVFGAVVFRPGEKAKYEAPGDEEISGSAQELFNVAQAAENKGDFKRAIKAYRALLRRHPKDMLAAGAAFRWAQLEE